MTRRELLAMVEAIKNFHHYLHGQSFLIRTDHASFRWLTSFRELEGQLARWSERFQQYNFEISHRKGQSHGNADGLSRLSCAEISCKYCSRIEKQVALKEDGLVARIVLQEDLSNE